MDRFVRERGSYVFGRFQMDAARRALTRDGAPVVLTRTVFDTLLYLVENQARVVTKEELMGAIWPGRFVEDSNLTQTIFMLRKALKDAGDDGRLIVTSPGQGYRFTADVRQVNELAPPDGAPSASELSRPARDATASLDLAAPGVRAPGAKPTRLSLRLAAAGLGALLLLVIAAVFLVRHAAAPDTPSPSAVAFNPPPHSVAVLAFENLSGDPGQAYFADGLSEELINSLGRIDALQVASRVSAFSFKGKSATVGQIARVLNVGAVLEGSVRRDGANLRVTAQLIDAASGFQLWSKEYDRDRGELLTIQRDIAQAVATSLQVVLVGDDVAKLTLGGTANPDAQDEYLRGLMLLRTGNLAGFHAALAQFNKAIAADAHYARAYTGIATAQVNIAFYMADPTGAEQHKAFAAALAAVDKSIAMAPTLAPGHSIRSMILDRGFLDPAGAYAEAARALALQPGNASVQGNFANVAIDVGHTAEAVSAAKRATELDPMQGGAWGMLADMLYDSRRYDESLAALRHAETAWGALTPTAAVLRGHIHLMQGHPALALQDCQPGDPGIGNLCLAMAYYALGRRPEALAQLAKAHAAVGSAPYYDAQIYAQEGEPGPALNALELAFRNRDTKLQNLRADPLLDPIRDTPRFKDIVRKMNFPP